jgi:spore maturation protein CgeB
MENHRGPLREQGKTFQRMCCMESQKTADDDLIQIGEESAMWSWCEHHNVYVGFAFTAAPHDRHEFPEAHESDTLEKVRLFHWFLGCM